MKGSAMLFRNSSKVIDPKQAKEMMNRGILLIDVREVSEWNKGHAPGAIHLPLGTLQDNLHRVPRDSQVLVCCRSGNRSAKAVALLTQQGYQALDIDGGMAAWDANGLPVVNNRGTRGSIV